MGSSIIVAVLQHDKTRIGGALANLANSST